MSLLFRLFAAFGLSVALAACASGGGRPVLPTGQEAYAIVPPPDPAAPPSSYVIAANDLLSIRVFQEPELSSDKVQVDDVGNIQMPLVGEVPAAGRTATQLGAEIADRLGRRYVVDPQVVVGVAEAAARLVTVEGQVTKPGVYEIDRDYTLLSALARAESPTRVANLDEIIVFRTVNGQRLGAMFNLDDIRKGRAADPQILGGDVVVVGFSAVKGAFRDFLQAAPLFNLFTLF